MTDHVSKYEYREKHSQSGKTRCEMRKEEKNRVVEMKVENTGSESRGTKREDRGKNQLEREVGECQQYVPHSDFKQNVCFIKTYSLCRTSLSTHARFVCVHL